jgi:molybdopterin synthase sulfur carrier subunit
MRDHSSVTVRVVYLARLRDRFERSGESFALPVAHPPTVAALLDALRARGGAFAAELDGRRAVRVAINHEVATPQSALREGDEVALFPPVTGG